MDINAIVVALIGSGSSLFLFFQNRANNKRLAANDLSLMALEKTKLDGVALDRAKALYEGMIAQLESQVTKLRAVIDDLEKDLDEEREENTQLRAKIRDLEDKTDELEEEIYQLKLKLTRLTA